MTDKKHYRIITYRVVDSTGVTRERGIPDRESANTLAKQIVSLAAVPITAHVEEVLFEGQYTYTLLETHATEVV